MTPAGFKRPDINLDEVLEPPAVKVERKTFKCGACDAAFVSEGRWALHMQRHKGEPGVDVPASRHAVHQSHAPGICSRFHHRESHMPYRCLHFACLAISFLPE